MAEGLVTLTTDLKSLKYNSMPLGSEKPYVTKNIGQSPGSQLGMQVTRRVDDLSRISQMLVDKPGLKFLGNQALLQQGDTIEKLQKASSDGLRGIGRQALQIAKDTVIGTAKIVGSTLAQVPVNGTGTHFVYGFRTNTYLKPTSEGDISAFREFFGEGGVEGAPLALRGSAIEGKVNSKHYNSETRDTTRVNPLGYEGFLLPQLPNDRSNKTILELPGNASRDLAKEGQPIPLKKEEGARETTETSGSIGVSNQNITSSFTYQAINLKVQQPETSKYTSGSTYQGEVSRRKLGNIDRSVRRETRINLGDQGAINVDDAYQAARRANAYTTSSLNKEEVDKLNALDIQTERLDGTEEARDLAKFFFEVITPESSRFLYFRAFITSLDDSYTGNWDPVKYVGRGEEFYTYGGFSRDINIGFKIAAATRSEMRPLYRKMVYLASTTAPTYSQEGFMRGTFVKLSLGSYFNQLPGVLTSVKYTWNTDYPWEIALSEPEGGEGGVQELPMVMDCSISFKPIHNFVPQTGLYNYITSQDKQIFFKNGQQI